MIEVDGILYEKMSKKEFKKRLMNDLNIKEAPPKKAGKKLEPIPEAVQVYAEERFEANNLKKPTITVTPKTLHKIKKVYK